MPEAPLALPQETTWKLLAVSPDMMDVSFCDKRFPFRWRSSLAIWAFEPRAEDLPQALCEGRITLLKIAATITGYQPTREEATARSITFPNLPTQEVDRIIGQYFACYGALLNVAVFPSPNRRVTQRRVVIDFRQQKVGTTLPLTIDGVTFAAPGQPQNRVVDLLGDGHGELDLFEEMVVQLPRTSKVEAKLANFGGEEIKMEAFAGATSRGLDVAGPEPDRVHELAIEGAGIDRVVFTCPQNQASLLELAYLAAAGAPFPLIDYPHIIDFEPKTRELVQASTEVGEVLTASKSNLKTNKSLTHTESTETGFKLTGVLGLGSIFGAAKEVKEGGKEGGKDGGKGGGSSSVTAELSYKNTETEQDNWSVATDASRERQEKQGSTTQISQLYNLLSSYHIGTNRAQFLMLARPHVLQPTDHRTFVDGLRHIEGVQEFILIVARPPDMEGLCVEASLETGHFPEGLTPERPPDEYEESHEDFKVVASATDGDSKTIQASYHVGSGWVVDIRPERGQDPGRPGVKEIANDSNEQANNTLVDYNYGRFNDDVTVQVTGEIDATYQAQTSGGIIQTVRKDAHFDRTYRVFTRSIEPKPNTAGLKVPVGKLLITSRRLCACFRSTDTCPVLSEFLVPPGPEAPEVAEAQVALVDERDVEIGRALLTKNVISETRMPVIKELMTQIQRALTTSGRSSRRRPFDEPIGFLDSDYFKDEIKKRLPCDLLSRPLRQVKDVPTEILRSFGEGATVADALEADLAGFARATGLDLAAAAAARRKLLGSVE